MVPDEDFKKSFAQAVVPSSVTVRHVLRRLDPISRAGSGVQPTEVEVEHILPKSVVNKLKNPKSEITLPPNDTQWLEDLGKQMPSDPDAALALGNHLEHYLNMLGNQALLNNKANRGARNKPFEKKKAFYAKQALQLTNGLSHREQWGLQQIVERQEEMSLKAPLIWRK